MKKTLLALTLVVVLIVGCAGPVATIRAEQPREYDDGRISVISTIFPGYDFARRIAGDRADVSMLIPPGMEAHSFEPNPQDIINIMNADVFIYIGGDADEWVSRILGGMDTSGMTLIQMKDLVDLVYEEVVEGMEHDGHDHDHAYAHEHQPGYYFDHEHGHYHAHTHSYANTPGHVHVGAYDEHVWTSPLNAILISRAIAATMAEVDPENSDYFTARAEEFVAELEEVDAAFRQVVATATRDTLVFGDRFPFRYFVDEYGLDYFAAFSGCSTRTDASPRTIAFLIDRVNQLELPVVLHIELSNTLIAGVISESTGAQVRQFHAAHNLTSDDFVAGLTYLDIMWQNVEVLREALH